MPEFSISATVVIMLISMIFTGGVTWGITQFRQKSSDDSIQIVIQELKTVVSKLQDMATEIQVSKMLSARFEKALEDHDSRIRELESQVAKLTR